MLHLAINARLTSRAAVLALPLALAPISHGHLSILRQGSESAETPEIGDQYGRVLCVGDFNGDGFEDLAASAPLEDVPNYLGTQNGVVVVSFGSPTGLSHVGAQVLGSAFSQDQIRSGLALASADFDSDGYDDLIVGSPWADVDGSIDAGVLLHYRGGTNGLGGGPAFYDQTKIGGSVESGDLFGWSLAAGDLNADGFPDLVIGSPGENNGAGLVGWILNNGLGLPASGAGYTTQALYGGSEGADDFFGYSLAIGQFTGQNAIGVPNPLDLAVGAPLKDASPLGGTLNAGQVTVFRCGTSGPMPSLATVYTPSSLGLDQAAVSDGLFGRSLAGGDFLKDPYHELAVGRPGYSSDRGEVVLLHGQASFLTFAGTLSSNEHGFVPQPGDLFGEALASGDWDDDGAFDLAVGAPGDTPSFTSFAGAGSVYLWLASTGAMAAEDRFDATRLGEQDPAGGHLGQAVAFGRFDGGDRAALAAGAPGMHTSRGQVHVVAPWRQVLDLECRTSVALDCTNRLVFSQKPFEPVFLASTTKTMTVLIAAERTQLPTSDPDYVDPQAVYTVPAWVADNIGGSQYGLVEGEAVTLQNLMAMTMAVSGNDAAFAIADLLTGSDAVFVNAFDVVPDFVAQMNARAAQLGMFSTTFTNPAGFSGSTPESTAFDMALLSRAAMDNPTFAGIVGTPMWTFLRSIPAPGGGFDTLTDVVAHWFVPPLAQILPHTTGIKGGFTNEAQTTGVYSAQQQYYPWGTSIATSFHTPTSAGSVLPDGAALLTLGLSECVGDITAVPAPPDVPFEIGDISPQAGQSSSFKIVAPEGSAKTALLELHNQAPDSAATEVALDALRESRAAVPGAQAAQYRTGGVDGHDGIAIVNEGATPVTLEVVTNGAAHPFTVLNLMPGESGQIPPDTLPSGATAFSMNVEHVTGAGGAAIADLRIREHYSGAPVLGDGGALPSVATMAFERDVERVTPLRIDVLLTGLDTDPGHRVGLVLREDEAGYAFDPCRARILPFGAGWSGALGVPFFGLDGPPVMGSTVRFRFGNSSDQATSGFWAIGLQRNALQTTLGGTLLVKPLVVVPVDVPVDGFEFPYLVPTDPFLCGVPIVHQLIVADPAASDGLAFSRGLDLRFGN